TYGDSLDTETAKVYQAALPGYKIVGVDNGGTEWGDSVHCRSRNLIRWKTVFIFPRVTPQSRLAEQTIIDANVVPSPGAQLSEAPKVTWQADGRVQQPIAMTLLQGMNYRALLPKLKPGARVDFYIEARDSAGIVKRAPINAPQRGISITVL
ncbi:MAG: hypothetical protein ABL958_21110, partial [Bdellovibrionia bacterium]